MPEDSTTADLVELVRRFVEAGNRRDFDAVGSFYAPDVVVRGAQIGTFEGAAAARGVVEDMTAPYDEFRSEVEEALDLGAGVAFAVVQARGHVGGASAEIPFRFASVTIWSAGLIEQQTNYTDIDDRIIGWRTIHAEGAQRLLEPFRIVRRQHGPDIFEIIDDTIHRLGKAG